MKHEGSSWYSLVIGNMCTLLYTGDRIRGYYRWIPFFLEDYVSLGSGVVQAMDGTTVRYRMIPSNGQMDYAEMFNGASLSAITTNCLVFDNLPEGISIHVACQISYQKKCR